MSMNVPIKPFGNWRVNTDDNDHKTNSNIREIIIDIFKSALLWNAMKKFTNHTEAIGNPKMKFIPRYANMLE